MTEHGEIVAWPPPMSAASIAALAIHEFGCEVLEVRLRQIIGRPGFGTRIVVAAPDAERAELLVYAVLGVDGTIEGNPATLALGLPLPDLPVVTFWLPPGTGTFTPVTG